MSDRKAKKIIITPQQHFDLIWRKPKAQYRRIRRDVIDRFIEQCEKFPEMKFQLDQAHTFRTYFEDHPAKKKVIRKLVKDGRLEIVFAGESIIDVNMVVGESIIRNIILGKRWFEEEMKADMKVFSMADAFGMNAQIPQILSKSGFRYLRPGRIPCQKDRALYGSHGPFKWKGLDGSVIIGAESALGELSLDSVGAFYGWGILEGFDDDYKKWEKTDNYDDVVAHTKLGMEEIARTKGDVVWLQLSGEEHLPHDGVIQTIIDNHKLDGTRYSIGTMSDYFEIVKKHENKLKPLYGDINPTLTGCYTTRRNVKKRNRDCEIALLTTEALASLARIYNGKDHTPAFDEAWRTMALAQFHDGLCGCHLDETYTDMMDDFDVIEEKTSAIRTQATKKLVSKINTKGPKSKALVVFNTTGLKRRDVIRVSTDEDSAVVGSSGETIPTQKDGNDLVFVDEIPSFGYKTYWLDEKGAKNTVKKSKGERFSFETNRYSVVANKTRLDIYDKHFDRLLNAPKAVFPRVVCKEDTGTYWTEEYSGKEYIEKLGTSKLASVESGDVFTTVRYEGAVAAAKSSKKFWDGFKSLKWVKEFVFFNNLDEIHFNCTLTWKGKNTKVFLRFPVSFSEGKGDGWYGIPFGMVKRSLYALDNINADNDDLRTVFSAGGEQGQPDKAYGDWPALSWVDYTDGKYGLTIANKGTIGHRMYPGEIEVSLLRSPTGWKIPYFPIIPEKLSYDNGIHEFNFLLVPHSGDVKKSRSYIKAEAFNNPFVPVVCRARKGEMPSENSFLTIDDDNIIVSTFKTSYDRKSFVLRLYEAQGKRTKTSIKFNLPIKDIEETNLVEEGGSKTALNKVVFEPFEIKTFRLKM